MRRKDPVPASALVADVLRARGLGDAIREHRLVTRWEDVVGDRVAARAWPDGLDRGVLWVRVVNSAWLHELSFLREAVAEQANRVCGARLVSEVRFHLGPREKTDEDDVVAALARRVRPKRVITRRPPLDPETRQRIAAETSSVADPELRGILRGLRERLGM